MIWARNIVISLLVACTLSSSFLVPLIYLDFEVRRDYIETVLCIERDKPMTVCKGSCVLNERLDLAREHDQNEQQQIRLLEIVFFIQQEDVRNSNKGYSLIIRQKVFEYESNYEAHLRPIFHPPSV